MAKAVAHSYGKDAISVYRIAGDSLFACEARVIVRGEAFETSYTEGDNSMVVATDSMKNFVHAMGLEYEGDTLEGFVELVGSRLLARYDHMEGVQVSAKQVPFEHVRGNVMRRRYDDFAVAELDLDRSGVVSARSGWHGLHLIKLTGSSFAGFVRDEYTTLPEAHDRPLFVHMNVGWTNADLTRCAPCRGRPRPRRLDVLRHPLGVHSGARLPDRRARAGELRADRRGRLLRREPALGHARRPATAPPSTPTPARPSASSR